MADCADDDNEQNEQYEDGPHIVKAASAMIAYR